MASRNYALHAHNDVVHVDTYNRSEKLRDAFNVIATDTYIDFDNDEKIEPFVTAVEAKNYPITAVLWHPETQTMHVWGENAMQTLEGKIKNDDTDSLNFYFS